MASSVDPLQGLAQKPKALDLFCGAGGASMGLHRAGFEVTGVDWTGQPHYPFAMKVERVERLAPDWVRQFDLVWASPPCQRWSTGTKAHPSQDHHPDLIPMTRSLLEASGAPYVIENVPQAPLRRDLLLCGSMFPTDDGRQRRLVRHRIFECSFPVRQPAHKDHHWKYVTVAGTPGGKSSRIEGIGYGRITDWSEAMGIDWMPSRAMAQAVPPSYSEYIGRQFLALVKGRQ